MTQLEAFLPNGHEHDMDDLSYTEDELSLLLSAYVHMSNNKSFAELLTHMDDLPEAHTLGPLKIYRTYVDIIKKSHGLESKITSWLIAYPLSAKFDDEDPEKYFTPIDCCDQNMLDLIASHFIPRYEEFLNLILDIGNNGGTLTMYRLLKTYAGTDRADILNLPDSEGNSSLWYLKDTSSDAYWLRLSPQSGKPVLLKSKYRVYLDYIELTRSYSDDGQKLSYVAALKDKGKAIYDNLPDAQDGNDNK